MQLQSNHERWSCKEKKKKRKANQIESEIGDLHESYHISVSEKSMSKKTDLINWLLFTSVRTESSKVSSGCNVLVHSYPYRLLKILCILCSCWFSIWLYLQVFLIVHFVYVSHVLLLSCRKALSHPPETSRCDSSPSRMWAGACHFWDCVPAELSPRIRLVWS